MQPGGEPRLIGLYHPGTSRVHRLPARAKLTLLIVEGVLAGLLGDPAFLAMAAALPASLLLTARIPFKAICRQLKPVALLMAAVMAMQVVTGGWRRGLVVDLRLAALALTAALVTLTTRTSDLVQEAERMAGRLPGLDPQKVGLVLSVTIRFIPLLAQKAHEVRDAQRARGLERSILALCVPLLIKSLQIADQTSEALQARGLE